MFFKEFNLPKISDRIKYSKKITPIAIPQFVDRERELEYLGELYEKREFSLVVIYGRQRVGKTALIKGFLNGKKGCYVLLTNESEREYKVSKRVPYRISGERVLQET